MRVYLILLGRRRKAKKDLNKRKRIQGNNSMKASHPILMLSVSAFKLCQLKNFYCNEVLYFTPFTVERPLVPWDKWQFPLWFATFLKKHF